MCHCLGSNLPEHLIKGRLTKQRGDSHHQCTEELQGPPPSMHTGTTDQRDAAGSMGVTISCDSILIAY